jgi:hypothetical protein
LLYKYLEIKQQLKNGGNMKPRLNKKLALNKITIDNLNKTGMDNVLGGGSSRIPECKASYQGIGCATTAAAGCISQEWGECPTIPHISCVCG